MLKEKLIDSLKNAVSLYNGGMSADSALAKTAETNGLNTDQTERLVEMFNSAKTIDYFGKHASDRTGKFDIADKSVVAKEMFGLSSSAGKGTSKKPKAMEKKSSADATLFYSFYSTPAVKKDDEYDRRSSAMLDRLAKEAEDRWSGGYSDRVLSGVAKDKLDRMSSMSVAYRDAGRALAEGADMLSVKIAESLSRKPGQEDRYATFMALCGSDWQKKRIAGMCPSLEKFSESAIRGILGRNLVDDSCVSEELSMSEEADRAMRKSAEYEAEAKKLEDGLIKISGSGGFSEKKKEAADMIEVGNCCKSAGLAGSSIPSIEDTISNSVKNKNFEAQEAVRDNERGAILEDLIANDPIISEEDPGAVADAYKSMLALSPRLSMNKEIVRSVLRQSVNSVATDVATAKLLSEVDNSVKDSN